MEEKDLIWGTYSWIGGETASGVCTIVENERGTAYVKYNGRGSPQPWESDYIKECGSFSDSVRSYFENGVESARNIRSGLIMVFRDNRGKMDEIERIFDEFEVGRGL